ncbi:MAG: lipopolysaccharide biosynthesis protein [Muribaculaceae bacterium]|nr:lipopolysaccharide biosynthesis protein [Muribaculaceae bacterium]
MLARELSTEDFGLVGALLVFQAFASLFVDSGFSYALIQRKRPSRLDYSTVLWFNLALAGLCYAILALCAPWIADIFQGDRRLVPLGRVMFLAIILNAACIVQVNRLMKAMDVRMVAVSNSLGLVIGGVVGIALAFTGFGAWAIVWQTVAIAAVKVLVLWTSSRWRPLWRFSWRALRSYARLGTRMLATSFLNTVFLNIYSFLIGNRVGLSALGYYSQSDKWSKMGITSISQVLTSSFVPALSAVQDTPERFRVLVSKMNRFTAYIVFPAMFGLMCMAESIFHALFGAKWDPSIILFQILVLRGIFVVLNSLYTNYQLALGHGNIIMRLEVFRDAVAIIALVITFPYMGLSTEADPVEGLRILLWGQLAATVLTTIVSVVLTARLTGLSFGRFIVDNVPYLAQTLLIAPVMIFAATFVANSWLKIAVMTFVGLGLYLGGNYIFGSAIQRDAIRYLRGRM